MERKIGEIFEYNDEWYQCVIGWRCKDCTFNEERKCYTFTDNNNPIGDCSSERRTDKCSVIFKKLEKAGEPYGYFVQHKGIVMLQPYKLFTTPIINGVVCNVNYVTNTIDLEIKQTKEDMEDLDKIKVRDYTKVEELNVMEEKKLNLKPFDIQKAREGKPVCTIDGRKARIICFDLKDKDYPIVAAVRDNPMSGNEYTETLLCYTINGEISKGNYKSEKDLMMLPEKKEGWVNVYRDCEGANITKDDNIYSSKDAAIASAQTIDRDNYVATTIIKWEE